MTRLHIPVPEKVLPWQVTVSVVALFIGGVNALFVCLVNIVELGDRAGLAAAIQEGSTRSGTTVAEAFSTNYLSMTVFSIIGVVYLALAFLLWRGEHRHGVRMIGTIMAVVSVVGIAGVIATSGSDRFQVTSTLYADLVVQIIILVGMIMLWEGGGRRWEHEGA
jgi:uncharacterized membrane protein